MRCKLDENLGVTCFEAFQCAGWDVETVVSEKLCGAPDSELIEVCKRERRCLITLDLDFANPLRFPPESYQGIVVIRLPSPTTKHHLRQAASLIVRAADQRTSLKGKLWIASRRHVREYHPDS